MMERRALGRTARGGLRRTQSSRAALCPAGGGGFVLRFRGLDRDISRHFRTFRDIGDAPSALAMETGFGFGGDCFTEGKVTAHFLGVDVVFVIDCRVSDPGL